MGEKKSRFKQWLKGFMAGRYGTDQLNTTILWTGVLFCLISIFVQVKWVNLLLNALSYVCVGVALFRCFSRNTYKRYKENRRFLFLLERLRDKEHRYFKCPKCRQSVRVPRGKGKIAITCPRCREKFVKKA